MSMVCCWVLSPIAFAKTAFAKTHIYVLAGQSNMMGKTHTQELPARYRQQPPNVRFYYQGRQRQLADDVYFGPEISFAHQVASVFPDDQHIIIKYVASGSYIREWSPKQPLYQGLLRQIQLVNLPEALSTIDAIVWMQGESDCRSTQLAQQYGRRLHQFITQLRRDLASPNSLFIMGGVSPQNQGFPAVEQVRVQQQAIHQTVTNTRYIETNDLPTFDNTHFNTDGLLALGERFAAAYIESTLGLPKIIK
ncbi:MAG: sialate O-acetylesterase [bacterium]